MGVGCGEACDGNSIGGAAHIVQACFVAEENGIRVPALFAADTDLKVCPALPTMFHGVADQKSHPFLVNGLERIMPENMLLNVSRHK